MANNALSKCSILFKVMTAFLKELKSKIESQTYIIQMVFVAYPKFTNHQFHRVQTNFRTIEKPNANSLLYYQLTHSKNSSLNFKSC